MKSVLLINPINLNPRKSCNPFYKEELNDILESRISLYEQELTTRFNDYSKEGKSLAHQRIYDYNKLKHTGEIIGNNEFGAFFFKNSDGESNRYKLVLGPVIDLTVKSNSGCNSGESQGCNKQSLGCNTKMPKEPQEEVGCNVKEVGCNNDGKKNRGCNPSDEGEQYVNYRNNELNTDFIKNLNDESGLRQFYKKSVDDFEFISYFHTLTKKSAFNLNDHYDQIIDKTNAYIESIQADEFRFDRQISFPSSKNDTIDITSGILLSDTSGSEFEIEKDFQGSVYLSGFDLMFTETNDFFKTLSSIPIIGQYLLNLRSFIVMLKSILFGRGEDEGITSENISLLEETYNREYTEQSRIIEDIEKKKKEKLGMINVYVIVPDWESQLEYRIKKFFRQKTKSVVVYTFDISKKKK